MSSRLKPIRFSLHGLVLSVPILGRWAEWPSGNSMRSHYDIASYTTDRFNVFGGQGTAYLCGGNRRGTHGYRPSQTAW